MLDVSARCADADQAEACHSAHRHLKPTGDWKQSVWAENCKVHDLNKRSLGPYGQKNRNDSKIEELNRRAPQGRTVA